MSQNEEAFRRILIETVEKSLNEVVGEKITTALHFYVDLPTALVNPDGFMSLMATLLSPRQAQTLRERILERLHENYGSAYKATGGKFSAEIANVKSMAAK